MLAAKTSQNLLRPDITGIKPEDRNGDGSLNLEAREKAMSEVELYLRKAGYVNISEISRLLGLARRHTKALVLEVINRWNEEHQDQIAAQIMWYENLLLEIDEHSECFDSKRIALIAFKTGLIDKINGLQKLITREASISITREEINFSLFSQLKPKTLELLSKSQQEPENQLLVQ